MQNVIRLGKRAFSIGVVGATIAWSMGLAALVQPFAANAAMAGDLVKGSLPAVYYYAADGKRYVFPNLKTYSTWYGDFSGVKVMSDADIAALPLGGNVVYRAGTRLVKIQTDPRAYAVEPSGKIRWIESEAVASALYGANWATKIDDVPDVYFFDYMTGASLADASKYPAGSLVQNAGSANVYYVVGSSKRWIDPSAMAANLFMSKFVNQTSQNLSVYTDGTNITGMEAGLSDVSQKGGVVTPPVGGGLSVSLASDTPAGATLPQGASGVPLLGLVFTAPSAGATITGLVLKRFGVGTSSDFSNLYLYGANGARLTDGKSVNSSTQEVTFTGFSAAVAAGASWKVWVKGDVGTGLSSGGTHGFQLASAANVTSNGGAVTGSFPVSGNQFTIGAATAGTVTITKTGTITNPTLGQKEAEIARFTLAAASEDAMIKQLNLDLEGTINNIDLMNLSLWQGTTKISSVASITSNGQIVFSINPGYALTDGNTKTFSVKADVGGESARTTGIRLEEAGDLWAVGGKFGFGMQITNGGYNGGTGSGAAKGTCAATTDDCSFSTVQGSKLTFAFNGPSATDVSTNSQDQVFMKFSVTAQQFTTIKSMVLVVTCSSPAGNCDEDTDDGGLVRATTEANLKDIRIRKVSDGTLVSGPVELALTAAGDDAQSLTFGDDFTLNAGQTLDLMITADVDNNATAADVFNIGIDVSEISAEDTNGDTITNATSIIPTADITGNNMTLRASALTIAHTTPPSDGASQSTVRGTNGKDSVAYSFTAGNASNITVSSVMLTTSVDGDMTTDTTDFQVGTDTGDTDPVTATSMVSSVSLYDGDSGVLLAGPESVTSASTGTVTFNNFTWVIPKGQSKKLLAKANIANYTVAGEPDAYAFRIAAAADVTTQDVDGNSVVPSISSNNGTAAAPTVFIRVTNAGTIAVSLDAGAPKADILIAGSTDVTVAKYRFDATNEGMLVNRVTISEAAAAANGGSAGGYDNNISLVKLSYQKQDGTTATATGFLTAGQAIINIAQGSEFYIPANKNRVLTVMVSLPTTDNGATTGEKPRLDFDVDTVNDDQFQAVGVSSGVTLDDDDAAADVTANQMMVRKTRPTLGVAVGSPSGAGAPGLSEVLRFTVAANAGEDVILKMLTFKLTTTDIAGTDWNQCDGGTAAADFSLYNAADAGTQLEAGDSDWALLQTTGAVCTTQDVGFARVTLTTPEVVSAGTTKTYLLKVDTTGASSANDDSFRADIVSDPITSTFIDSTRTVNGAVAALATSITLSATTGIVAGDLVCFDEDSSGTCGSTEEIALVTSITNGTVMVVYRGDLGRTEGGASANGVITTAAPVLRMPASLYWDDDGSTSTINGISAYLVKNLDVNGGTIIY